MNPDLFLNYALQMGVPLPSANEYLDILRSLEQWLAKRGIPINDIALKDLRKYLKHLIKTNQNTIDSVLVLKEYYFLAGRTDLMVFLSEVSDYLLDFENIVDHLEEYIGKVAADEIRFMDLTPPYGTDPNELPVYTEEFLRALYKSFPEDIIRKSLSNRNDGIIPASYEMERSLYQNSASMDEYLLASARMKEIRYYGMRFAKSRWGDLFFPEEYLRSVSQFQEILSGVRRDGTIYVTQEPLLPGRYSKTKSFARRRYYACQDPYVRASFLNKKASISVVWCERCVSRCKQKFEYLLERPLTAEVVECAIMGDTLCRFAIHLSDSTVPQDRTGIQD